MKHHLTSIDPLIWPIVQDGFVVFDEANPTLEELKKIHLNARATNSIFGSLSPEEYNYVIAIDSAKEVWETLEKIHEGTSGVKETKIDVLTSQLESFIMSEEEAIDQMYSRLNVIVNELRNLGEPITDHAVVKKLLRSLPKEFNPLVLLIKDKDNFKQLRPTEVLGRLKTHAIDMEEKDRLIEKANIAKKNLP
jgi:hypothetical protein